MRIEPVQGLADLHGDRSGYWEDRDYASCAALCDASFSP